MRFKPEEKPEIIQMIRDGVSLALGDHRSDAMDYYICGSTPQGLHKPPVMFGPNRVLVKEAQPGSVIKYHWPKDITFIHPEKGAMLGDEESDRKYPPKAAYQLEAWHLVGMSPLQAYEYGLAHGIEYQKKKEKPCPEK